MELPTEQDDGAVATLLEAFVTAVEDKVREMLGDANAASSLVAAAPKSVVKTRLASGSYGYEFSVKLPPSALAVAARRLKQAPAGVRGLAASALDSLSTLLTDGTLTARMMESGVSNVQDLIDSGAMGVAADVVAPSPSPSTSPSTSPSGRAPVSAAMALSGLPASAFDASGKLTNAAVATITSALKKGIEVACPTCDVTVTRVVDSAGNAVYAAGRRLQSGTYTVSFLIGGAAAAAAAANVNAGAVAAQLSGGGGFNTPITAVAVVSNNAGVASGNGGLTGGAIAGIAVAATLVVVFLILFLFFARKQSFAPRAGLRLLTQSDSPARDVYQPRDKLMAVAPPS